MKVVRKIIEIDEELCNGCGECIPSCAEGALEIVDGKAKVIADKFCDGLGACLGECPMGALAVIEREAEDFDEEEVEAHLARQVKQTKPPQEMLPSFGGCPSARIENFRAPHISESVTENAAGDEIAAPESALAHWPVQIMLVPPTAPFLKGAELLVVADCVPVAFADFHRQFLKGKAVMLGCPKFDDTQAYVDKFSQIAQQSGIKSITSVVMEVPCCSALPMIIKKGLENANATIPMEEVVISTRGKILQRKKAA